MGAVSWSRGKKTADRGNLDTSPKALMALRAGSREYCNSELQYSPLSAVFFPQLHLTAPKTLPTIPMSGSGSLLHQIGNNAHEGWQVIYQITCQYILRRESIKLSRCMLYVPSWAASFVLVLLRKRVTSRNHPFFPAALPFPLPDRRTISHESCLKEAKKHTSARSGRCFPPLRTNGRFRDFRNFYVCYRRSALSVHR